MGSKHQLDTRGRAQPARHHKNAAQAGARKTDKSTQVDAQTLHDIFLLAILNSPLDFVLALSACATTRAKVTVECQLGMATCMQ